MRAQLWALGLGALGLAATGLGCGTAPPPAPPAPPPAAPTAAPPVVASAAESGDVPAAPAAPLDAGPDSPEPGRQVTFEPTTPTPIPDPPPHVEIRFPVLEKPIRLAKAPRYRVRMSVQHWPLGKDGAGIQLALDDASPRVFKRLDQPIRLADLLPADRKLAAGPHRLFAVAVYGNGEMVKPQGRSSRSPFSTVRFHVGARGAPAPDAPRLVYSQPRGTYNGETAADRILLDYYLIGAELGSNAYGVDVRITGRDDEWGTKLREWTPRLIRGLPSGDYRVTLQLIDREGAAVSGSETRVSRTITINRDAPRGNDAAP